MTLIGKNWDSVRIYLLLFVFGCILAVLGKIFFFPEKSQSLDKELSFPSSIALSQWEFLSSKSLSPIAQRYQYRQEDNRLTIDAESQTRAEGSVNRMLMTFYKIKPATIGLRQIHDPERGYTASFEMNDKLYLTACLNPVGHSTITDQQFISNRYRHGWSIGRTFLWLIGQQDLFDGRCLWTTIYSPLPDSSTESDRQTTLVKLQKAWLDWSNFWQGRW